MAQGRLIGGKKFLIHAHGVATEMGSKKWPKQADVMLLRQIKICKELTGQRNLGLGCPTGKESKPSLGLGQEIRDVTRLFI